MLHDIGIYYRLLGVQLRSQMQYRLNFIVGILAAALISTFEFGSLALVMQRFENIRGWTIAEVAFLYGLVEIAFGTMDLTFGGFDPSRFGNQIRKGLLDQLLLRPVGITWQVLGSDLALRRIGRIAVGITIFSYAVSNLSIDWTAAKILFIPFIIGGMVAYFGGLFIIGATITIWTVEAIEVMNVLTYGGSFAVSYPMTVFQDWLQRFFTYIVPAIFLNFYPALWILDKPDPYGFPEFAHYIAPFVGLALFLVALTIWRFGLRRYQSTGS